MPAIRLRLRRLQRERRRRTGLPNIAASRDRRPTFLETIRESPDWRFSTPAAIRTLEDGRAVVRAGADKVTGEHGRGQRRELISELSREFGAQAVVTGNRRKARWATIGTYGCGRRESASRCHRGHAWGVAQAPVKFCSLPWSRWHESGFDCALTRGISKIRNRPGDRVRRAKSPGTLPKSSDGAATRPWRLRSFTTGCSHSKAEEFLPQQCEVRLRAIPASIARRQAVNWCTARRELAVATVSLLKKFKKYPGCT